MTEWRTLTRQVFEKYSAGDFLAAAPLAEQALALARREFGPRDSTTLRSLTDLGVVFQEIGRYREAEQLHREALATRKELLGLSNFATQTSMNDLAAVLTYQGKYAEAEKMYREVLAEQNKGLGPLDKYTLTTLGNLGSLLADEGRLGEAESDLHAAFEKRRLVLGDSDPDSLTSGDTLARLLAEQRRYPEAIELYKFVLERRQRILGPEHPRTLTTQNNLAISLSSAGMRSGAQEMYTEILSGMERALGTNHPDTMNARTNLVVALMDDSRFSEAEPLARSVYNFFTATLGEGHPKSLSITNNLAMILNAQRKFSEAEPLFAKLVSAGRATLGARHPSLTLYSINRARNLAAQGRVDEAVQRLSEAGEEVLAWVGLELGSTEGIEARRQLLASEALYQDMVLSLALTSKEVPEGAELAASVLLRFKNLSVEEEAYLAHLSRVGADSGIRTEAIKVRELRAQLARLFQRDPFGTEAEHTARDLDAAELELARLSGAHSPQLQVGSVKQENVRRSLAKLPVRSALLELRQFSHLSFIDASNGPPHWAGVLISGEGDIIVRDLGPIEDTARQVRSLIGGSGNAATSASRALYEQVLAPFAAELEKVDRVYIAPDGLLYLVPFGLLTAANGRTLLETKDVRLLQSGRDLLRAAPDQVRRGLVAMGGIDFDHASAAANFPTSVPSDCLLATPQQAVAQPAGLASENLDDASRIGYAHERARGSLHFGNLPHTKEEVDAVATQYCAARPGEPIEVDTGAGASKARLLASREPPRVLHLATHGFYMEQAEPADRPLLLAGIALAGANAGQHESGDQDGILSALEALDVNLEGTELVVLSACETAQGQIDYGEGVAGLVRALRTAGARNVLVTLRPIGDKAAAMFMERVYRRWLGDAEGDIASALRTTQLQYIEELRNAARPSPNQSERGGQPVDPSHFARAADNTWASFVLIGN
jgi:CHAT domain-containing protein/tetratricopeptide (TPR) repeat protein